MNLFKDKVAIITGGASGMGRALCERLGAFGANLIIADIDEQGAGEVAEKIRASGGTATAVHIDTANDQSVKNLVTETRAKNGRLDYMFNNAGILIAGEVHDMTDEQWQRILDVNFKGVLTGTLAAYKVMIEQGFGHIINTASGGGLVSIPILTAYCMTKHAIVGLSTGLRQEGAGLGIKVSAVCPGFVGTSIFDKGTMIKADMDQFIDTMPIKPITPEKAAKYIIKGVAKNQGIIIFPPHARMLWAIFRICPSFFGWGSKKVVDDFRKMKKEDK